MAARSYIRAMGLNGVYNEVDEYMAGQVVFVAGNAIPTGYLECNGATVSRTTYATLFSAIGSIYGPGDGATTFKLPDLRGEFLRGADKGRGIDSGRAIGTVQLDQIQNHSHEIEIGGGGSLNFRFLTDTNGNDSAYSNEDLLVRGVTGKGIPHAVRFGVETRPRNVAMTACIKY